jgi:hypothetical protein
MNPYDKMLNTIVEFKEYLDDIIKKGYKNDIVKLSSIYHMIKEYKDEQETNDQMITFEYNDIDMKEIDDISEQFMINMLEEDDSNDLSITQVVEPAPESVEYPEDKPTIILYKNNKHYQENLGRFLKTMDYY